jgi:hypothetical protein
MGFTAVNRVLWQMTMGRLRGLLVLGALLGTSAMATAVCRTEAVEAWAGVVQSDWQEYGPTGKTLLTERGQLLQQGLGWRGHCADWHLQLQGTRAQGSRLYQGQTNQGVPVSTTSDIHAASLDAQVWYPVAANWSLGGRLFERATERDLKSVGAVQGYVENFHQSAWAVGLQHQLDTQDWGRWQTRVWHGVGRGHMHVTLPGMDAARLPLGAMRWWAAQLQWSGCRGAEGTSRWGCDVALNYQSERLERGATQPIYRQGLLRARAYQPSTHQQALGLNVGVQYRFD